MRKVEILETFDGYPASKKVTFTRGEEVEVSETFADIIVGKGLAKDSTKTVRKTGAASKEEQHGAE